MDFFRIFFNLNSKPAEFDLDTGKINLIKISDENCTSQEEIAKIEFSRDTQYNNKKLNFETES